VGGELLLAQQLSVESREMVGAVVSTLEVPQEWLAKSQAPSEVPPRSAASRALLALEPPLRVREQPAEPRVWSLSLPAREPAAIPVSVRGHKYAG
jgi:hypothetical protein